MEGVAAFHSIGSCLNSQKHELNFQISAIPCVRWQLVHQQRAAEPRKAGWKALGSRTGVVLMCTLKIKETVNCCLGPIQGSTQACLQSRPSATSAVSGDWKEGSCTALLSKAGLKPESNARATEVTAPATKTASYAFWQHFSSETPVQHNNSWQAGSNRGRNIFWGVRFTETSKGAAARTSLTGHLPKLFYCSKISLF